MSAVSEVYEKFKHLDKLLGDTELLGATDHLHMVLCELWVAVRTDATSRESKGSEITEVECQVEICKWRVGSKCTRKEIQVDARGK